MEEEVLHAVRTSSVLANRFARHILLEICVIGEAGGRGWL